ncbi:hypothetical protein [Microvirga rosea]|uniref:hypothetical protein n=1 Tax=Microvirga rosea TaxID=2715425 RepID=UPI001D0AE699|nr:hypothetical protein [Microvirga rosea]MCB8823070.1 hypothetical protein [Microvirga rosea]
MVLSKLTDALSRLSPKKRRAEKARAELRANAEKALRMKQEADTGTHIPPHQTSHEGMRKDPSMMDFDRSSGREAGFTPQLKRSKVARSGDAS